MLGQRSDARQWLHTRQPRTGWGGGGRGRCHGRARHPCPPRHRCCPTPRFRCHGHDPARSHWDSAVHTGTHVRNDERGRAVCVCGGGVGGTSHVGCCNASCKATQRTHGPPSFPQPHAPPAPPPPPTVLAVHAMRACTYAHTQEQGTCPGDGCEHCEDKWAGCACVAAPANGVSKAKQGCPTPRTAETDTRATAAMIRSTDATRMVAV